VGAFFYTLHSSPKAPFPPVFLVRLSELFIQMELFPHSHMPDQYFAKAHFPQAFVARFSETADLN
jgi:hypothetical protein